MTSGRVAFRDFSIPDQPSITVSVDFRGGLQSLVDNQAEWTLKLPAAVPKNLLDSISLSSQANKFIFTDEHTLTPSGLMSAGSAHFAQNQTISMLHLVNYICANLMPNSESWDAFVVPSSPPPKSDHFNPAAFTIRPGVLVLINDTDWELVDEMNYHLRNGDRITFVSTLHGG